MTDFTRSSAALRVANPPSMDSVTTQTTMAISPSTTARRSIRMALPTPIPPIWRESVDRRRLLCRRMVHRLLALRRRLFRSVQPAALGPIAQPGWRVERSPTGLGTVGPFNPQPSHRSQRSQTIRKPPLVARRRFQRRPSRRLCRLQRLEDSHSARRLNWRPTAIDNGIVDAADYTIWRDHLRACRKLPHIATSGECSGAVDDGAYSVR